MRKNILYIILCLTLLSCEKTIDFNETSVKPFMVLNSYLTTNEVITAEITKSQSVINEFNEEIVTNAEVSVFEDDALFEKLSYDADTKSYKGTKYPIVGKKYSLKASANGFDNISSEITIPVKTAIVDYSLDLSDSETWEGKINATIKFKDDPNKKNYYRILVEEEVYDEYADQNKRKEDHMGIGFFREYVWDGNIRMQWLRVESKDPALTGKGQGGSDEYFDDVPDNIFNVFNDELFDGEEYSMDFSFNTLYYDGLRQKITIYLLSVTEDYYLYLKSYASQIYFADSPFSEPVQIYSNIKNGAGVMGAYNFEKVLVYDRMIIQQ